ncbi:hypothetical protein F5Y06DRAFT_270392 [Hypoxylon sp. FL0890]|nr:hypothetical protein F5Y06DRAFT_270392 [Hypoxylon sp. FL0890]
MRLKDPPSYTQRPDGSQRERLQSLIEIYHPGYTPAAPLLVLRAFDDGALLYSMVYVICCIVLGNVWTDDEGRDLGGDGPFLSKSSNKKDQRFLPDNLMVPAGVYYLHYPGYKKKKPYPIVPHFNYWKFPDNLPKSWRDLRPSNLPSGASTSGAGASTSGAAPSQTPSAYDSDRRPCPLTGQVSSLEESHILPQTTKTFIKNNNMRKFVTSKKSVPTHLNPQNKIFFREDVHTLWDSNALVFVPKPDSSNGDLPRLVSHVLNPPGKSLDSDLEIHTLHHNIPILPIGNPLELIFARFAWSLFTKEVIVLFADDDGKAKYSVLVRDMKKDTMMEKSLLVADLPRLLSKATGVGPNNVAGEKRRRPDDPKIDGSMVGDDSSTPDIGELGFSDNDVSEVDVDDGNAGNFVYSVRTGKMERVDDHLEPGDCDVSSHSSHDPFSDLSDNSDPPGKKSRSSSLTNPDAKEYRRSRSRTRIKENEPVFGGDRSSSKRSGSSKPPPGFPHSRSSDHKKRGISSLSRFLGRKSK